MQSPLLSPSHWRNSTDQSGLSFRSCAHTLRIKQSKKHLWLMIPLFQNTASPIMKTSSFLEERATANNG